MLWRRAVGLAVWRPVAVGVGMAHGRAGVAAYSLMDAASVRIPVERAMSGRSALLDALARRMEMVGRKNMRADIAQKEALTACCFAVYNTCAMTHARVART